MGGRGPPHTGPLLCGVIPDTFIPSRFGAVIGRLPAGDGSKVEPGLEYIDFTEGTQYISHCGPWDGDSVLCFEDHFDRG